MGDGVVYNSGENLTQREGFLSGPFSKTGENTSIIRKIHAGKPYSSEPLSHHENIEFKFPDQAPAGACAMQKNLQLLVMTNSN